MDPSSISASTSSLIVRCMNYYEALSPKVSNSTMSATIEIRHATGDRSASIADA